MSRLSLRKFQDQVAAANVDSDIVIVLPHFGITASYELTASQRKIAHTAVDAGADVVLGAHSHTLQGVEVYDSSPIFYSLGNFVFDKPDHWSVNWIPSETVLVEISISESGIDSAQIHPALCDSGPNNKPRILDPSEPGYSEIQDHVSELSSLEGTELEIQEDEIRAPI